MTQPGQKRLTTGIPGIPSGEQPAGLSIDNGAPQFTLLPVSGGTVVLNGATPVVVANANVTAGSVIVFTLKTVGGTVSPNAPNVLTITPGTGFTVGGTAGDTSTYNFAIFG